MNKRILIGIGIGALTNLTAAWALTNVPGPPSATEDAELPFPPGSSLTPAGDSAIYVCIPNGVRDLAKFKAGYISGLGKGNAAAANVTWIPFGDGVTANQRGSHYSLYKCGATETTKVAAPPVAPTGLGSPMDRPVSAPVVTAATGGAGMPAANPSSPVCESAVTQFATFAYTDSHGNKFDNCLTTGPGKWFSLTCHLQLGESATEAKARLGVDENFGLDKDPFYVEPVSYTDPTTRQSSQKGCLVYGPYTAFFGRNNPGACTFAEDVGKFHTVADFRAYQSAKEATNGNGWIGPSLAVPTGIVEGRRCQDSRVILATQPFQPAGSAGVAGASGSQPGQVVGQPGLAGVQGDSNAPAVVAADPDRHTAGRAN